MIRAGLYAEGSDPVLDQAIRVWPDMDEVFGKTCPGRYRKLVFTAGTDPSEIRKPFASTCPRNVQVDPQRRFPKTHRKQPGTRWSQKETWRPNCPRFRAISFYAGYRPFRQQVTLRRVDRSIPGWTPRDSNEFTDIPPDLSEAEPGQHLPGSKAWDPDKLTTNHVFLDKLIHFFRFGKLGNAVIPKCGIRPILKSL